jgi:hypothetical protein
MAAHTQIPIFNTSSPKPALLGNYSAVKTNAVALKHHLKKPEKNRVPAEWQNND